MVERLIKKKRVQAVYPKGSAFIDYDFSKAEKTSWWNDLIECIETVKADCYNCWPELFYDYFRVHKLSLFRKILDSFEDIDYPYRGQELDRYTPQTIAFWKFIGHKLMKNNDIQQSDVWKYGPIMGTRKIYIEQQERIESYSENEILEQLFELSNLALSIPMTSWENDESFGLKIIANCSNYKRLLVLGYLMPPKWYIKEKLGETSWLKILQRASIIDDKGIRGMYGTRVLAKDGHECNSIAEMEIDNWLFEKGIKHEKEPLYPYDKEFNPNTKYRGDFKIGNTIIEYAGLMTKVEYREKMVIKEKLAKKNDIPLIILTAKQLHQLEDLLKNL